MLTIKVSYKSATNKRGARVVCESFYGKHTFPYDYAASNTFDSRAEEAFQLIKADMATRGLTWQHALTRKGAYIIPGTNDILVVYG